MLSEYLLLTPLLLLLTFACQLSEGQQRIVVQTQYGKVEGRVEQLSHSQGKSIDVFFGIPFARPPIGPLRYEKPLAPERWEGTRPALEHAAACIPHSWEVQNSSEIGTSEDCLYLNVFAPHRTAADTCLFPVLVLIHGGAFELGTSHRYADFDLLGRRFVSQQIVLVSIQYRLGWIGFASTGNSEMPGNLGIWDQIEALRFLRDNIAAFGGDANRTTVFGYSAGSGSVGLLSISPQSRDLFQQGIKMSGTIFSGSGAGTFVPEHTRQMAKELGCPEAAVKKCLGQKSVAEMWDAMDRIGPAPLAICIAKFSPSRADPELFPADFPQLIASAPPKRMMMGFTELDFLLFSFGPHNTSYNLLALTDDQISHYDLAHFEAFVRDVAVKSEWFDHDSRTVEAVRRKLIDFYANKYEPTAQKDNKFYLRIYTMLLSDLMDIVPTLWEAQQRIDAGSAVFLYESVYFNADVFPERTVVHATYHTYDHSLIFDEKLIRTDVDQRVSDLLVGLIVNFVANGDPSSAQVKWEPTAPFSLSSPSVSHLRIDGPSPAQQTGMRGEMRRAQFWMEMRHKYPRFDLVRDIYGNGTAPGWPNACALVVALSCVVAVLTGTAFWVR